MALRLGLPPLDPDATGIPNWTGETPLWFYIGREAAPLGKGERLGPVGGRLVTGVLVALLDHDPGSFRRLDPGWTLILPAQAGDP